MFGMKKILKYYGNTLVVVFDSEDQKIENLEEGDVIEFLITKIIKQVKKK